MCQCSKVKDRDRERQADFALAVALHSYASKNHTQVGKWTFHFIPASFKAIPVTLRPQSELWEQRADISLLGGLGKHTRLAPHHTTPSRTNHLSFGKEWTMGRGFSAHSKELPITKINWAQLLTHSRVSIAFFANMHSERAARAPDISWFTGTDKKKIKLQCGYQKIQVVKVL